jgi:hypothetical protein
VFRQPSFSGSTATFIDTTAGVLNFAYATNGVPAGNPSARVLDAAWTFRTGTVSPWLRLTTFNTASLPNPVIDFRGALSFDILADRDLYVALGLRESNPTAGTLIGANGGTTGAIEFVGGTTDNTVTPPLGRLVRAGAWTRLTFYLPNEPVRAFTGNGVLETTTGLGVLEHLAIVPATGTGAHSVWLDNFQVITLAP